MVGQSEHGDLQPGDTIEVHYLQAAAKFEPRPTLGGCVTETNKNPQLRVEAQVYVPVNDESAAAFMDLTALAAVNGFHQAVNIPTDTGIAIKYAGSTTGPGCNEKLASPGQRVSSTKFQESQHFEGCKAAEEQSLQRSSCPWCAQPSDQVRIASIF